MIKKCNKCGWLDPQPNVRCGETCCSCSEGVYVDSGMSEDEYENHRMRSARNRISRAISTINLGLTYE